LFRFRNKLHALEASADLPIMNTNPPVIGFPVEEIKEASGANHVVHTSFLAGSIVACGIVAVAWFPEFIVVALIPLGLLWERTRLAETILAKRLRQYQLDESVTEAIERGELEAFSAAVDQEYREKSAQLMAWIRQRPSVLERVFMGRRYRKEDDNKSLRIRLWELSYLDDRIRKARCS
jgi:hypothetical protein